MSKDWTPTSARCLASLAAALLLGAASIAGAQDPSRDYFTIATTHFRVSFTRPLEPVARRVAADAERAYAQLSASLHPPRGAIDVLVTDDFDFSNGSATPSPTNRIIVYAMPPVNDFGLRYTTDWAQLVVTHELTHIFHLDRVRGIWRLGQYVFGRSPFLFPNSYQPSWLVEGLAVYEESRLAGQGRINGPEHRLVTAAIVRDRGAPPISSASLALPTFPQGSSAYVLGSLFMDWLARTRGDSAVRRYVESSSVALIPYLIDIPARRAFGTTFSRAWGEWIASVDSSIVPSDVLSSWRPLTGPMLQANYPRWADSGSVSFTGTTGRETFSAWSVSTSGDLRRQGARNGASPTVVLPNGDLLFAQYEYDGPYRYRSDLFVERAGGDRRRLTTNARLFAPDANAAGDVVAMQVVEGATRLVRVSAAGNVSPITASSLDTLWSEPRWSRRGDRIVASRWLRGGIAQIVVLDSIGRVQNVVASARRVLAAPSWAAGDSAILFTDDGRPRSVRVDGSGGALSAEPAFAILEVEQRDAMTTAGVILRGDGYELGVGHVSTRADTARLPADTTRDPLTPPLAVDSSKAVAYSGIGQLIPRYWAPQAEQGYDGAYLLGGYTEAWDILRRHYLYADARFPTDNTGVNWSAEYQYRGFGLPVVATSVSQDWTPFAIYDRSSPRNRIGTLRRRVTDGDLLMSFVRQRVRSSLSFSVGAGLERRDYRGDPPELLAAVDSGGIFGGATFPRVSASASYARYYSPAFSISPEDGLSLGLTARERLRSGFTASDGASASLVGALSLYKSLDLPGYAHHVLAVRGSAGWADTRANGYFDVGGVSGGTYQIFPGYTVGEGRKTFPVRGFAPGAAQGIRAATASVEYRAPLLLAQHGISTLPTFLQRSSLTLFGDYGIAWCPNTLATRQVCVDPSQEVKTDLASIGGEISVSAGLLSWDTPTRLRFGVAVPMHNGAALGAKSLTAYFTTGLSF